MQAKVSLLTPRQLSPSVSALGSLVGLFALPQLFAGIGLLRMRTWGRILGIIVAIFSLPGFPLGTALGVYGLVILFNQETAQLFAASARARSAPPNIL
ncbi:hypothetical protein ACFL6C_03190 [Myxococcota bacterium]